MKKVIKRLLITLISVVGGVALIVGGLMIYRHMSKEPVGVYAIMNVAMTEYWGDTSETEGIVETRNMQSIYASTTQKVTEVYVTEGQYVSVGDPIMAVDTTLTEIELERQRIKVEQKKLALETAEKELAIINTYVPWYPPTPEPEPEKEELPAENLPKFLGGEGTQERPYIYLWDNQMWYSEAFINGILPKYPETNGNTENSGDNPENSEVPGGETEESTEGSSENTGETEETSGMTDPSGNENGEDSEGEESQGNTKEIKIYVVFEVHEYNNSRGDKLDFWQIEFTRKEDNTIAFRIGTPAENYDGSEIIIDDGGDTPIYYGPQYTWSEIQEMKDEKAEEIRDLGLEVRIETVKYEKLQMEMQTGLITATVDGVVKMLQDPDVALRTNTPMCVISGGGGYYIVGTLNELELATVHVGQMVKVTSWMNYAELEAEIVEISEYPTTNGWSWSNGNTNVSYYPFTVYVSDDANLQEGEYVSIQYTASEASRGFYLQNPFILQEGSKCYVYVANEENILEKREVTVGRALWGSYMEILSGVTMEDRIAFPYGKNVVDGAPAEDKCIEDLYSYGY